MKIQISLSGEKAGGLYSSVKPLRRSTQQLTKLFNKVSYIDPHVDDLHCTVLYSENKTGVKDIPQNMLKVYVAHITEFVVWTGHNGVPYLVALLESPSLRKANRDWMNLGYSSTYPDYRPHITVKKEFTLDPHDAQYAVNTLNKELIKNPFSIIFSPQVIEPLKDD